MMFKNIVIRLSFIALAILSINLALSALSVGLHALLSLLIIPVIIYFSWRKIY